MSDDRLIIAGREFKSRLWVGTGKYKDFVETKKAIDTAGADVVTVAVRRVNITDRSKENLLDYLDPKKYTILPNTAGCYTVEDALRYARLARAAGISDLVKLEVIGDERTLFPDGLNAPRIAFENGRVRLGMRYGTGWWSSIISVDLHVWLAVFPDQGETAMVPSVVYDVPSRFPWLACCWMRRFYQSHSCRCSSRPRTTW